MKIVTGVADKYGNNRSSLNKKSFNNWTTYDGPRLTTNGLTFLSLSSSRLTAYFEEQTVREHGLLPRDTSTSESLGSVFERTHKMEIETALYGGQYEFQRAGVL